MQQADAVELVEQVQQVNADRLATMLYEYDVVDVVWDADQPRVILTNPVNTPFNEIDSRNLMREVGFTDASPYTSWTRIEHVPALRGRTGLRTFYDMKRSDGAVRGALRTVKTGAQGAEWYVDPASDTKIDKNIAEFVSNCLFEWLDQPWERVLENCLLSLEYGFFIFEKVFEFDQVMGKFKLKKLAPIHPLDVMQWLYSPSGELVGLELEPIQGIDPRTPIRLSIDEVMIVVFEMEAEDLRGTSILRSAYQHWYFKSVLYKIDAVQKERHGVGVPIIELPMGFSKNDLEIAQELARNIRANEYSHITVPEGWKVYFMKLEGQPVDLVTSIEHHDRKIYENIMAAFMGVREVNKESIDTFFKSSRYMAKTIAATFNKFLIPSIVDSNFIRFSKYPKLKFRRIGEWEDFRTLTFALRNLVGAGILTPDQPLEDWLRDMMGMPPFDPSTARKQEQPQNPNNNQNQNSQLTDPNKSVKPPKVGLPKQQTTPPIGLPSAQAGTDRSGG